MNTLRIVPLGHWLIVGILVLMTVLAPVGPTTTKPVEAATITSCTPHAWRGVTWKVSGQAFPGATVGMSAGLRYNGCRVEGSWIKCSAVTIPGFSVTDRECFFHRVSADRMHMAFNFNVCTPIGCWDDYMRMGINHHGRVVQYFGCCAPVFISH